MFEQNLPSGTRPGRWPVGCRKKRHNAYRDDMWNMRCRVGMAIGQIRPLFPEVFHGSGHAGWPGETKTFGTKWWKKEPIHSSRENPMVARSPSDPFRLFARLQVAHAEGRHHLRPAPWSQSLPHWLNWCTFHLAHLISGRLKAGFSRQFNCDFADAKERSHSTFKGWKQPNR